MTKLLPIAAILLSPLVLVNVGTARAQDAAPPADTPRCGGVLCDMGLFTGKRDPAFGPEPTCGFFCKVTGGQAAADAAAQQQAAAQAQQAADAAATPEPKPHHKVKRKHAAKATTKPAADAAPSPAAEPKPN